MRIKKKLIAIAVLCVLISYSATAFAASGSDTYSGFPIAYTLTGSKTSSKATATATTSGAVNPYKNYVNVYIRNSNGQSLKSGYKYQTGSASASKTISVKDSSAKYANSYHAITDSNNQHLEDYTKQKQLRYDY